MASSSTSSPGLHNSTTTLASVSDQTDDWISKTPKIVFLAVFIGIGFFGNLFFVITVCQSRRFRNLAFFVFLCNLAVINLCECSVNMSLVLAASILNEWTFGEVVCKVSSFFLNLINKETFLALTVTSADRYFALKFKEKYDTVVSRPRIAILITFSWVQSFSFSLPIAVGTVQSGVNKYVVYCTLSKGSSIIYAIFSALLCFVVPFILIIVFFVKIVRTNCKRGYMNRNLSAQHHNYADDTAENPRDKQEMLHTNIAGTLCIVWLVLEGPHFFTSYYSQFSGSAELSNASEEEKKYIWYVDLVLLWLRFSYVMALPIVAFTWHKDLWKCFKDFILCRKNNSVVDESFKKAESDTLRLERKIKEERMREKETMVPNREQRVFQVPVLFATSHGVHIKTFNQNESSENDTDDASNKTGTWTGRKCDVEGSRDNLNNVEDDTSDYDSGSELDPFSVSHPVSVRQYKDEQIICDGKRSLSEPEVRSKKPKPSENERLNLPNKSNGDSGVDLSSSPTTNAFKGAFHVPSNRLLLQNSQTLQTELLEAGQIVGTSNTSKEHNEYKSIMTIRETEANTHLNTVDNISDLTSVHSFGVNQESTKIIDSPTVKRKKKRRKEKTGQLDTQSTTSLVSNSAVPPRPPARLAPIVSNSGTKHSAVGSDRSGSACSGQNSKIGKDDGLNTAILQCNGDIGCDQKEESVDQTSSTPCRSRSNSKTRIFNKRSSLTDTFENSFSNDTEMLQLDCKREINCVPEEILTPSSCQLHTVLSTHNTEENSAIGNRHCCGNGVVNSGFEWTQDSKSEAEETETKCRNVEARRKRRERREKMSAPKEKFTPAGILNDGYQRLVPETP